MNFYALLSHHLTVKMRIPYTIMLLKQSQNGGLFMYEFKEEYVTGIATVDAEHRRLFEIADEAYQLTKEEFLVDKYDQVRHILSELREYALMHFEHEEAYMSSINYKHMFIQKVQHDQFR